MKKKKWLLLVLVIAVAVAALAGCDNNTGAPVLEGDGDIVWDENGNVVYDNINLKMWSVTTGDDANTQDQIVAGFNSMYEGMIHVTTWKRSSATRCSLTGKTRPTFCLITGRE